jgi:hypothetical protein
MNHNPKPSRPTSGVQPGLSPAPCSATGDELIIAFVQGAQSWEYEKTRATMWPSDRNMMEKIATERLLNGTLGKSPNAPR